MNIYNRKSLFLLTVLLVTPLGVFAQSAQSLTGNNQPLNINDSNFSLVVCDGPLGTPESKNNPNYRECNFNTLMKQVQHVINIMMVVGVLASIGLFAWAGGLYITGNPNNIKTATAIFQNVLKGFIIMIIAWFVVYQILSWLVGNDNLKYLLGK